MKPNYLPSDIAFRTRVSDAAAKFVESNQTMPTHVMISSDLFKSVSYAVDDFAAGDVTVCGLKIGINDKAPNDTLFVVRVLSKGGRR